LEGFDVGAEDDLFGADGGAEGEVGRGFDGHSDYAKVQKQMETHLKRLCAQYKVPPPRKRSQQA
jgi:hypothetical protein